MSILLQDLRYGARMLAKHPGFALIAVITLAVGIGVNTATFSLLHGMERVVHRLAEPERLVFLFGTSERYSQGPICPVDCRDYREQAKSFSDIAVFRSGSLTLSGTGEPEQLTGVRATANLLPMLGFKAQLGRLPTVDEDAPGAARVVVLTDRLWRRKFDSDPKVLEQTILLNGEPFTIVGVLRREFEIEQLWFDEQLLIPARIDPAELHRGGSGFWALGRLEPGVTVQQAQPELDTIAGRLAEAYPDTNTKVGVVLRPLMDGFTSPEDRLGSIAVLAAVGLVLLITCVNLANLLLAKSSARSREFAVRAALGAGRMRIMRQLLTETVMLAGLGGTLGLLLGLWAVDAFVAALDFIPLEPHEIGLNWPVLAFTLAVSGLAALVFGLTPALTASRVSVNEALKEGQTTGTAGRARNHLRHALVIGQLALALPLLVCCGLTLRHVAALQRIDFGYASDGLLTMEIDLPSYRYTNETQWRTFYRDALARLEAQPGVEHAGAVLTLPVYSRTALGASITIEGQGPVSAQERADVHGYQPVTPGFFEVLEAPLIAGRFFDEHDQAEGQPVALINERMAQRYWPGEDPVGKRLTLDEDLADPTWLTVVGVVGDMGFSLQGSLPGPPAPTLYVPFEQQPFSHMFIVTRTRGEPRDAIPVVRAALAQVDPQVPVQEFNTVPGIMHDLCRDDRLAAGFLGGLAILGLGLASIGLFGVMSFTVVQRTHEIGVRVALGAGRREIVLLVLGRCLRLALFGIAVGVALAIPVGLALQTQLYAISGIDPIAYLGVSAVLLVVAALAGYLPARRATKVDPMVALRCE